MSKTEPPAQTTTQRDDRTDHHERLRVCRILRRVSRELDKTRISHDDITRNSSLTRRECHKRFGTVRHARAAAGLHRPVIVDVARVVLDKLAGDRQVYVKSPYLIPEIDAVGGPIGEALGELSNDTLTPAERGFDLSRWGSPGQSPHNYRVELVTPDHRTDLRGWPVTTPPDPARYQ